MSDDALHPIIRAAIDDRTEAVTRPRRSAMAPEDVRAAREQCGWSQAELARRLGVHYSAVSRWEAGTRAVPQPVAMAIRLLIASSVP